MYFISGVPRMHNAHGDKRQICNLCSIHNPERTGISSLPACHVIACAPAHLNRVCPEAGHYPAAGHRIEGNGHITCGKSLRLITGRISVHNNTLIYCYPTAGQKIDIRSYTFADTYHLAGDLSPVVEGYTSDTAIA